MFLKLNKQFNDIEYIENEKSFQYMGFGAYSVSGVKNNPLNVVVPEKYRKDFYCEIVKIDGGTETHKDIDIITRINFYLCSGGYKTLFYYGAESSHYIKIDNIGAAGYNRNQLQQGTSFVANDGDAYLLDVTQPHSIDPAVETPKERVFFAVNTNTYTFDQVKEMLQETGYL